MMIPGNKPINISFLRDITSGILFSIFSVSGFSQGVAINETNAPPHSSALLDITSTNRGVLIPRMTQAQRNAIVSPQNGLLIYQTDNGQGIYYNAGTPATADWQILGGGSSGQWQLNGNQLYYTLGNVGIGTGSPSALLQTSGTGTGEGNVLFTGEYKSNPIEQGEAPASGPGTRMMWYPDKAALRAGIVTDDNWNSENTGNVSFAIGYSPTASGFNSFALGYYANATGDYAKSIGNSTEATGNISTAMGAGTTAASFSEFAVGRFNTQYVPLNTQNWNNADRLFVIGNGSSPDTRSDALVILKNGNTGVGTSTPTALLHTNGNGTGAGNILFTGTYKSSNPGDPPVSGAGTRMMWYPDKAAFRAGRTNGTEWDKTNIGNYSFSAGLSTTASGVYSVSLGYETIASGTDAVAMGNNTLASGSSSSAFGDRSQATNSSSMAWGIVTQAVGSNSTAWGQVTYASGETSTAWGYLTGATNNYTTAWGLESNATGIASTAWGIGTIAQAYSSTALGSYNLVSGNPTEWIDTDPLFVIGNGTDITPGNALTVLKNGRTGIRVSSPNSQLQVNAPTGDDALRVQINGNTRLLVAANGGLTAGVSAVAPDNGLLVSGESRFNLNVNIGTNQTPEAALHVRHANLANEGIRIQNLGTNNRHWTIHTNNGQGTLILYSSISGNTPVGNFNGSTGAYTATSNRHLKGDITDLPQNTMEKLRKLEPSRYRYLRDPEGQFTLGLIAEDVLPLFPELVESVGENGENLAINYAGFSIVAIKAIQEQQSTIEELKRHIEAQNARLEALESAIVID
ncbi:MAG: tail fiber domain-containing protein [Lentimicrobium sp.]